MQRHVVLTEKHQGPLCVPKNMQQSTGKVNKDRGRNTLHTTSDGRSWRDRRWWTRRHNWKGQRELEKQGWNQDKNMSTRQNSKNFMVKRVWKQRQEEPRHHQWVPKKRWQLGWQAKRVLSASVVQGEPLEGEGHYQSMGRLSATAAKENGATSVFLWKEPQKCHFKTSHTREKAELPWSEIQGKK